MKDTFEEGTEFRFSRYENTTWPAYTKGNTENKLEIKEEGAEMFTVNKTANYVMTVNINTMAIIFLNVYTSPTGVIGVVGDAIAAVGWDSGVAIRNAPLVQTDIINQPEVISYTGTILADKQFKFVGNENWGYGLFATSADANPLDINCRDVSTNGNGDKKWKLPDTFIAGTYTLEMNLHTMKINIIQR